MTALLYSSMDDEHALPLSLSNRGLCYGDGLFETIRMIEFEAPLWQFHRERFHRSCKPMGFDPLVALRSLDDTYARASLKLRELEHDRALVKIFAIRSEGGRGYAPSPQSHPDFYFQLFELPRYPVEFYRQGVDVKVCHHRLSEQPALAGVKHLNRLDQVIASAELNGLPEGLMLDQSGRVIEGTKSNILVFRDDDIVTPSIKTCGVAGTLRSALLAWDGVVIQEKEITLPMLENVQGVALVNSIFGVWPVRCLEGKTLPIAKSCRILQSHIGEQYAFPEGA